MIKKIIILFIALLLATAVDMYLFLNQPMSNSEAVLYELSPGTSVSSLAKNLKSTGLIKRHYYIRLWARISGQARKLKAGEYKIQPGMTPVQLLNAMVQGKVQQYSLTLVEGWNIWQVMSQIKTSQYLKHTLKNVSIEQIMEKIGHGNEHPEGRFYPDTYHFPKGMSDIQFLKRAYNEMDARLQKAWISRDKNLPFKTPYEALIMASIVEKESALAEERTRIAGVFINRLRKRMRLQTDPTVIYGLGKNFDGDIRFRDLRRDTPYNTYTRRGLPPTPIAMPGQGAIDAVMHPDSTEYLYFVARGDSSGSHVFSTNLIDHEKAVDKLDAKRNKKMKQSLSKPLFITLEGSEGVGKTSNLDFIKSMLTDSKIEYIETREPGGTPLGETLRTTLLGEDFKGMSDDTELLLMFAARAEHVAKIIKPALEQGKWVLCDRFTDSTFAYQGGGRQLDVKRIAGLENWVLGDLRPDLTLLLDAPVEIGRERAGKRSTPDRFEQERDAFFNRVRDTYLQRAQDEPERIKVIDASVALDQVKQQIKHILTPIIKP